MSTYYSIPKDIEDLWSDARKAADASLRKFTLGLWQQKEQMTVDALSKMLDAVSADGSRLEALPTLYECQMKPPRLLWDAELVGRNIDGKVYKQRLRIVKEKSWPTPTTATS